jgi:hypothetical protein
MKTEGLWVSRSENLRALGWLRDRAAIGERLGELARALDESDATTVGACLTANCEWDVDPSGPPLVGRAAVEAKVKTSSGPPGEDPGDARTNTLLSNLMIEVDGDEARADAYVFLWVVQPERGDGFVWGRWWDELVRADGTWQVRRHCLSVLERVNSEMAGHPVLGR